MFTRIDPNFRIEAANFGERNDRMIVFRLIDGPDEWEQIPGTRAILIGGTAARRELRRLLDSSAEGTGHGRPKLQELIPGGINSRTHHAMRKFCGF